MLNMKIDLFSQDAAEALQITSAKLKTTTRRVMGSISFSLFLKVKKRVIEGETVPWFQRRVKGLLIGYHRVINALKFTYSKDAIKGTGADKKGMVAAVEFGAPYQQWMTQHVRNRKKTFGKPANPYTENVRGYLRWYTKQPAMGYLAQSIPEMIPEAEAMANAGYGILIRERREPTRDEIRAAV